MKWTKKDIRTLCATLDTFALLNRPLTDALSAHTEAEGRIRAAIAAKRQDIVLADLRSTRARLAERYSKTCECIGNALVRNIYGNSTAEFVERFKAQACEEDEAAKKAEELVLRVVREGLPPEVVAYDPYAKRSRAA
jgi:hypothetical protein